MARLKSALIFLLQSVVVGLAAAFIVVLLRPELLPALGNHSGVNGRPPASYADAVDISGPSVANVYTRRLVRTGDDVGADGVAILSGLRAGERVVIRESAAVDQNSTWR